MWFSRCFWMSPDTFLDAHRVLFRLLCSRRRWQLRETSKHDAGKARERSGRSVSAQCVGGGGVTWHLQCETGVAGELPRWSVAVRVVRCSRRKCRVASWILCKTPIYHDGGIIKYWFYYSNILLFPPGRKLSVTGYRNISRLGWRYMCRKILINVC